MIIAVRDKDGFKVGVSSCDVNINMDEHDLTLAENLAFWKVKGEKGCYVALARADFAADVMRAHHELFRGLNDMCDIVERLPYIRETLAEYGLVNGDEYWDNDLFLFLGDRAFVINSYFNINVIDDFEAMFSRALYAAIGAMDATAGESAETRILKACKLYDDMRRVQTLPMAVYSTTTGKRKIYKEYPKF